MTPWKKDPNRPGHAAARAAVRRGITMAGLTLAIAVAVLLAALFVAPEGDRAADRQQRELAHGGVLSRTPGGRLIVTHPVVAVVRIDTPQRATPVPRSYFGLSTEYWSLPVYERRMDVFKRVLTLLHVRGDGPFLLRVGGDSADHMLWEARPRRTPSWAYAVTPAWLRATRELVRQTGLKLILDLNLITGSSRSAARWARAAEHGLPRRSIVSFEVGNEPDVYSRLNWLAAVTGRVTNVHVSFLPHQLSTLRYVQDFETYRRALGRVGATAPLDGPVLANPVRGIAWISSLLDRSRPFVGLVTAHRYLYSACLSRHSPSYPTIARLLSEAATSRMAHRLKPSVGAAHRAGLAFRLTELNSVSCRGVRGVSNSFATALWASDTLFELLRAGVDGVNVHVRTDAVNAAFKITRRGLAAAPLMYGLMLFAQTLSAHPQLVHVRLRQPGSAALKAWAVRVAGRRLHVLLINKGQQPVRVHLRLRSSGAASVERLLAPSPWALSGVTLGGQRLGADGRWHGRRRIASVRRSAKGYLIAVPAYSAALVSVRLAR